MNIFRDLCVFVCPRPWLQRAVQSPDPEGRTHDAAACMRVLAVSEPDRRLQRSHATLSCTMTSRCSPVSAPALRHPCLLSHLAGARRRSVEHICRVPAPPSTPRTTHSRPPRNSTQTLLYAPNASYLSARDLGNAWATLRTLQTAHSAIAARMRLFSPPKSARNRSAKALGMAQRTTHRFTQILGLAPTQSSLRTSSNARNTDATLIARGTFHPRPIDLRKIGQQMCSKRPRERLTTSCKSFHPGTRPWHAQNQVCGRPQTQLIPTRSSLRAIPHLLNGAARPCVHPRAINLHKIGQQKRSE